LAGSVVLVGGLLSATVFALNLASGKRRAIPDPSTRPLADPASASVARRVPPSNARRGRPAPDRQAPDRRHRNVTPFPRPSPPPPGSTTSCSSSHAVFEVGARTWPDCTDTGVSAGVALREMNSPNLTGDGNSAVTEITRSGTVINGVELTGSIDVWANNVTIENSVIRSDNWWGINQRAGYSGLRVLHCTIVGLPGRGPDNGYEDYAVSSAGGSVEVGWSNLSGFGDAISLGTGYIHDNYVHDLQAFIPAGSSTYNHDDAFISDGGSGLVIEHNTFLDQVSITQGASSSVGLFYDSSPVTNATVEDNFMAGGSYALYPGGGPSSRDVVITGNVFSTMYWPGSGYYGPVASSYWHYGSGNSWSDNTWADGPRAGQEVQPG
jgi:hypothetical protein